MPTKVKLNGQAWSKQDRIKFLGSLMFQDTKADKLDVKTTAPYVVTLGAYTHRQ